MKRLLFLAILMIATLGVHAQRKTDQLDRGLVAVKTTSGVYCSWRILGEEYYDVTYNLYRDGTKINGDQPLEVTNFLDAAGGTENSTYTVTAVVNGKEGEHSKPATVWAQKWLEIVPDHGTLTSTYIPNDACCADVDGDGELEILMKFDNQSWAATNYRKEGYNGEYFIIEVYKLNGKKLWWVELGPNMADFQNNEQNIVAYDWDEDGRAEAVMRASDGTVIHMADGTTQVIGDKTKNYLGATNTGQWFVHEGSEFLLYLNGETGKPYQVMDYPLKRLEAGETDLNAAWGDGYGHRSTKHFFGAPCLDGRRASIFLARGIYTRHKMVALDVNPTTHELTERWRWTNNTPGSAWYAQGYHNFAIADVDWDGRDEICFGSMVIDDNGKGLSTAGLGHGDAQHQGDFNPYIHGHEIFACNEDEPANNYRDATTSKIYYRMTASDDDGRCMAGNFTNDIPGAMAFSAHDEPISCVTASHVSGLTKNGVSDNFRIYWDGDLLEETQNYSNGKNTAVAIYKYGKGEIERLTGSMTNNDTKGTPCYQGDILGDWREEVIARTKDNNIRIYTTTIPTDWRIPTLWHDHQYRQAMVWQMCGYNQPPHVSYFLGELEGITQAPPPLTMTGRTEIANNGSIGSGENGQQVLMAATSDMTVSVADGAAPGILFDNAPSWVQGHNDNNNITTEYFTHKLTGGAFTGSMRLVKQGDGTLWLPTVTETYTGATEVWAGTLHFDGTMQNSKVWLNRFAVLESDGGKFQKGIRMDYGSELRPGGKDKTGSFEAQEIWMGFGSRIVFDVMSDGTADHLKADRLCLQNQDWQNGPKYSTPVIEIVRHGELAEGKYLLMEVSEILDSTLDNIVLEGIDGMKASLIQEDGKILLNVEPMRDATDVVWDGSEDGIWNLANAENFMVGGNKDFFVTGDNVTFNDQATNTTVTIVGDVKPASVTFDNSTKDFTVKGTGSIIGTCSLFKKGTGSVTINNVNKFNSGVYLQAGKVNVSTLANNDGVEYGALGGVDNPIVFDGGTLGVSATTVCSQVINIDSHGTIDVSGAARLTHDASLVGSKKRLTKTGSGTLILNGTAKYGVLNIEKGTVQLGEASDVHLTPDTVVLNGGSLKDPDNIYSYSRNKANVVVPEGKTASWTLDSRCDYVGKLLGKGTLTVNVTSVRCNMQGDWSQFEGTIKFQNTKTGNYDPSLQWNNSYGMGKASVTGTFHNDGKNVTIGTLIDKAVITGTGRTTASHVNLNISKVKGTITHGYIEVEKTLEISGDINITLKGTLSKGDRIVLWKVGSLQASNATLNLPTLPAGLYWDTSSLLQPEGVLRVTDQPTDIISIDNGQWTIDNEAGAWYTLDGRRLNGKPTTKGIYINNGKKIIIH